MSEARLPTNLGEITRAVALHPNPAASWRMRGDGFTLEIRQSTFASSGRPEDMRLEVLGEAIPDAAFDRAGSR